MYLKLFPSKKYRLTQYKTFSIILKCDDDDDDDTLWRRRGDVL
jgi:hypothetical protein